MKPWRRKDSGILPVVDDSELLDILEQEKIVQSLEASHSRQSFTWRCRTPNGAAPLVMPLHDAAVGNVGDDDNLPSMGRVFSLQKEGTSYLVVFATLTLVFSGFFLISAYWQAISPWELKYHAYFMEDMNPATVVVADIAEAVVYASMAWGLFFSKAIQYHSLRISLGAGFGLTVFWLIFMQSLSRMRWDLLWLPLGPCCCAALCLYVEHLIVETARDVCKLRTAMYHFKRM